MDTPLPGAFLEKSSEGPELRDPPLLYLSRVDLAPYITHAHCAVNLGYYCNQVEFQSLCHSSGVYPRKYIAVKTLCALVMCANAQEFKFVGAVLQSAFIAYTDVFSR